MTTSVIRPVQVTVSNTRTGNALVVPYSHASHRDESVQYRVPLFRMTVSGHDDRGNPTSGNFNVVRFGVLDSPLGHRVVGLADKQTHTLKRVAYMGGTWQIYNNFVIHDGADFPGRQAYGAIGCIEVTGLNGWQKFEKLVAKLSGSKNYNAISNAGLLTVHIEATPRPPLIEHN